MNDAVISEVKFWNSSSIWIFKFEQLWKQQAPKVALKQYHDIRTVIEELL